MLEYRQHVDLELTFKRGPAIKSLFLPCFLLGMQTSRWTSSELHPLPFLWFLWTSYWPYGIDILCLPLPQNDWSICLSPSFFFIFLHLLLRFLLSLAFSFFLLPPFGWTARDFWWFPSTNALEHRVNQKLPWAVTRLTRGLCLIY